MKIDDDPYTNSLLLKMAHLYKVVPPSYKLCYKVRKLT